MYAITDHGFRAVTSDMPLSDGEVRSDEVPAKLLAAIEGEQAKAERTRRLRACDWTQMDDSPLAATEKQAWAAYRRALRDMPAQSGFPDVPWPAAPSIEGGAASNLPSMSI